MDCVFELICKIRELPEMYISREESIHVLKAFLDGYSMRDIELNGIPHGGPFLDKFQKYIADYYREERAYSWATIIRNHSDSPEHELEQFFLHIDGFTKDA